MKMFVAVISGVLLTSAACAQHQHGASTGGHESTAEARESSAGAGVDANTDAQGSERLICRRIDRSESRMSRQRVCMTAAQWREHARNN